MTREFKGFVVGFVTCATLLSLVFASPLEKSITAIYDNIKIYVDGKIIQPKDANGDIVEPFTYNGTTYLPVRAIANAIGKDVGWDSNTNTVYLGTKPEAIVADDTKIINKFVNLTKEGFTRKIETLTSKPTDKTNVFSPDDTMYYVVKIDSVVSDFEMKFIVQYENEEETVLLDHYKFAKTDVEGRYMHVNLTFPEGYKLPKGNYTFKLIGSNDTETYFEVSDSCTVQ